MAMRALMLRSVAVSYGYGFAGLVSQADGSGDAWFVRSPQGNLVSHVHTTGDAAGGNSQTSVRYYLTDVQQSIIATVAANTTSTTASGETRRYLYEPYGHQIRSWIDPTPAANTAGAANPPDGSEAPRAAGEVAAEAAGTNPWRYASGYHDAETGWLKYGTRYYMPEVYRWTQIDPKAGTPHNPLTQNPYLYSGCNPVNETDASGCSWWGDAWDSVSSWDGWSGVGEFASLLGGCAAGATWTLEAGSSLVGYASIYGPTAAAGTGIALGLGGCRWGIYAAHEGVDAVFDTPVG